MSLLPLISRRSVTFTPRPYQIEAKAAVEQAWASGTRAAMLDMATGTGKTKTALFIVSERKGRIIWLAHRQELLNQPLGDMWFGASEAGVVQAGRDEPDARIVFASVQTLANPERLAAVLRTGHPEVLVVDEAHHSVSPSYRAVIEALTGPNTVLLGLTATADREDDLVIGDMWTIVYSFSIVPAIERGYLVPPYAVVSRPPGFDEHAADGRRDYEEAVGELLLASGVVAHTVKVLEQAHLAYRLPQQQGIHDGDASRFIDARSRRWLVFTATVLQARLTAEALVAAGHRAAWVSGETSSGERARVSRAFARGEIDMLCNAGVFTEGTDLPRCNGVVLARAAASWTLYVQMVGRALRLHDPAWGADWGPMNRLDPRYKGDLDGLIIDLAGATDAHSLVSAPVLLPGQQKCSLPGGVHRWVPQKVGPGATCAGREDHDCKAKLSCYKAFLAGGDGAHEYSEVDNVTTCVHCGQKQCADAGNGRHAWIPVSGMKYGCSNGECDAERPMPLASMLGDRKDPDPSRAAPEAAWTTIYTLDREVRVLDLDTGGLLFEADEPYTGLVVPWWLPPRARNARPMSDGPVPRWYSSELVADVVRRSKKQWDPWRGETLHGGTGGRPSDVADLRRHAAARAVASGVAKLAGAT